MRLAILTAWVAVAVVALLPLLRRRIPSSPPRPITSDELVKDPVCGTYIVRERALTLDAGKQTQYFCSERCRDEYTRGARAIAR